MRYLLLLLSLFIFSCHSKNEKNSSLSENYNEVAEVAAVQQASVSKAESKDKSTMLIKTCHFKYQVPNVEKSTNNIEKILTVHNAILAGMDMTTTNYEISNILTIRVPSESFTSLLDELAKESVFTDYKRIETEDVSEEFIDIQSRLQTKKEVRDRYNEILKNKAKTVDDVLKAEEQIRVLQEEIEAKEGRLKYLQDKVSLSTIHLTIYQKVDYKEIPASFEKPYVAKMKDRFLSGWSILTGLSLLLINLWPVILIGLVIVWKRNWLKEKLSKKQ